MNVFEGKVVSEGMKVGIVAARFNEFIVSKLVAGATGCTRQSRSKRRGYRPCRGAGSLKSR